MMSKFPKIRDLKKKSREEKTIEYEARQAEETSESDLQTKDTDELKSEKAGEQKSTGADEQKTAEADERQSTGADEQRSAEADLAEQSEDCPEEITWENALPDKSYGKQIADILRSFFSSKRNVIIVIVIAAFCAYFFPAMHFRLYYMPKTSIGNMNIAGLDREGAERLLNQRVRDYELRATQRNGYVFHFYHDDVSIEVDTEKTLDEVASAQHPWGWPVDLFFGDHSLEQTYVTYDEKQVKKKLEQFLAAYKSHYTKPQNAKLKYKDAKYKIKKEKRGDYLDKKKTIKQLDATIRSLDTEVNLDETACYKEPTLTSRSKEIVEACDIANQYVQSVITFQDTGMEEFVLDATTIKPWIKISKKWEVTLRKKEIKAYVEAMAEKYDTAGTARTFHTHEGNYTPLTGDYGWTLDQDQEYDYIYQSILNGVKETHTPIWKSVAASHDTDWGDTYIEIDTGLQKLWFYKDGEVELEADITSGDVESGQATKEGIFYVTGKDARDEANETGASRRLVLDCGTMIFDAPWVEEFGGFHHLNGGTEDGSVCMDRKTMQRLYDMVEENCAILVHETMIENIIASDDADGALVSEEEFDNLEDDKYEDYTDEERGAEYEDESEYEEEYIEEEYDEDEEESEEDYEDESDEYDESYDDESDEYDESHDDEV